MSRASEAFLAKHGSLLLPPDDTLLNVLLDQFAAERERDTWEAAAKEVEGHWDNTQQLVNQYDQAQRSAGRLRTKGQAIKL